jgi:signal transduction histidine kinase
LPVPYSSARRSRIATPAALDPSAVALAVDALAGALAARVAADGTGDAARRRLAAIRALPASRVLAELPDLLGALERDLAGPDGDADAEHDALRTLVHERHAVLLGDPAFAQWLEAPHRHAAMLAWLLRDQVTRLERADRDLPPGDAGLRRELARLREEHAAVVRELEQRRAQADVGLMAAGMVHDFNNVLTVISGHASIARSTAGPRETPSLDLILNAAHRASELSRTLLRWVRHGRPEPEPVDVSALVREVLDLLATSAPPRVLLVRRLTAHLPVVLADPIELRRVVLNLVVNAWQAIGDGPGEVTVATGTSGDGEREVWLEVLDDGRGMDADVSARIFDAFFTTRDGGTGLGLATVHSIVDRIGGRIEVWSQPGRGARFLVSLPEYRDVPREGRPRA